MLALNAARLFASQRTSKVRDKIDTDNKINKYAITPFIIKKEKKIKSHAMSKKYIERHYRKVIELKKEMDLPKKDESVHIVTQNAFNSWTFIPYILEKEKIINVIVSTYAISIKVITALSTLLQKDIIKYCYVLISTGIKNRKPSAVFNLEAESKKYINFDWGHYLTHAKVTLIKTANNFYVIEGSGNFNENDKVEQYVICNCKELYNFHKEWIYDIRKGLKCK